MLYQNHFMDAIESDFSEILKTCFTFVICDNFIGNHFTFLLKTRCYISQNHYQLIEN